MERTGVGARDFGSAWVEELWTGLEVSLRISSTGWYLQTYSGTVNGWITIVE